MNRPDIYWLPLSNGLHWRVTRYCFYISLWRLKINWPR